MQSFFTPDLLKLFLKKYLLVVFDYVFTALDTAHENKFKLQRVKSHASVIGNFDFMNYQGNDIVKCLN